MVAAAEAAAVAAPVEVVRRVADATAAKEGEAEAVGSAAEAEEVETGFGVKCAGSDAEGVEEGEEKLSFKSTTRRNFPLSAGPTDDYQTCVEGSDDDDDDDGLGAIMSLIIRACVYIASVKRQLECRDDEPKIDIFFCSNVHFTNSVLTMIFPWGKNSHARHRVRASARCWYMFFILHRSFA